MQARTSSETPRPCATAARKASIQTAGCSAAESGSAKRMPSGATVRCRGVRPKVCWRSVVWGDMCSGWPFLSLGTMTPGRHGNEPGEQMCLAGTPARHFRRIGTRGAKALSLSPDDRAARCPAQERAPDQDLDDLRAAGRIQVPEPRRLLRRETQAGHLEELAPDTLHQRRIFHGRTLPPLQGAPAAAT